MATLLQLHFLSMAHLATQWLSSLNRLLSRLIRNLVFCGRFGQKVKRTTKPVGSTFSLMKKRPCLSGKHTARLKNLGVEEVVAKVFDVNVPLSQINQAKLA